MRAAIKAPFSALKRSMPHSSPVRMVSAGQLSASSPAVSEVAISAPAVDEPHEKGWLRVTNLTEVEWLETDEQQRRFRLQAASRLSADSALSTPQREELLQRIDAWAAEKTGQPQPLYRGIPLRSEPALSPTTSAPVDAAPPAGRAAPAGDVQQDAGPSAGKVLLATGAVLLAVAIAGSMMGSPRQNPTGRKKRSWWDRMWGGSGKAKPKKTRRRTRKA